MDVTDSGFADSDVADSDVTDSDRGQQAISALNDHREATCAPPQAAPPFLAALAKSIQSLGLGGRRILVGVSGGGDSVALLYGLHALAEQERLQLVAAHLDHGIRGAAAADDAAWTAELCQRLDIPLALESADVPAYARERGLNLEEAARDVRYRFFERAAAAANCSHVAVAHTADDQVETVLHHLFRGTGLAGLQGMPATRPLAKGVILSRPLSSFYRSQLLAFLESIGAEFRTDESNFDEARTRSRIRNEALPELVRILGPQILDAVKQTAERIRDVQATIEELAAELLEKSLEDQSPDLVRLSASVLAGERRHIVREAFVLLWKRQNWPRQAVGFESWDRLWRLIQEGGTVTLPGRIEATRRGKLIVVRRRS
jgi:tRNA(Ile)-lysidine synthase